MLTTTGTCSLNLVHQLICTLNHKETAKINKKEATNGPPKNVSVNGNCKTGYFYSIVTNRREGGGEGSSRTPGTQKAEVLIVLNESIHEI